MKDAHPYVSCLYLFLAICFSLFISDPICAATSFAFSVLAAVFVSGIRKALTGIKLICPVALITAILTPMFVHKGMTVLLYLPWGNPLTKESVIYGAFTGVIMASVMSWFLVFGAVMTSDKIDILLGRLSPSVASALSISFRLPACHCKKIQRGGSLPKIGRIRENEDGQSSGIRSSVCNGLYA